MRQRRLGAEADLRIVPIMTNFLIGMMVGAVLSLVLQYQADRLDEGLAKASGSLIETEDDRWIRETTASL